MNLTIQEPSNELKPFLVSFNTVEEREDYIKRENMFCLEALKLHAAAWSKSERAESAKHLYNTRKAFYDLERGVKAPKTVA